MKILFLTDNFPPEVNAPAYRTYEHCKAWAESGEDVTVITCAPNFPKGIVHKGYQNKLVQRETIDRIHVIRVWSYISPNKGKFRRVFDFTSYAFMAFVVGLFIKTEVIIATSPQFFTAISGSWLGFFKRRPWVIEVRDLWPESIAAVGVIKRNSRLYRFLEQIELNLYQSAKKVITVTDSFKRDISGRGIEPKKIEVVKNGVELSKFQPIPKNQELLAQFGLENKFIIGYIGTHGMAHRLDFVLNCASEIKDLNIHFLLIGDGAEKENLLAQKEALNLNNVTMLPPVPKSEVKAFISIIDVALVNLMKSDTFKTVIPSKIFENAAMQKPILLGVEGESQEIIESYQAGISFEPENKNALLDSISLLSNDPHTYQKYQLGCKKLVLDFDRNKLAQKLLDHLYSSIGKRSSLNS